MQSFFVTLAVCFGVAFAFVPLDVQDQDILHDQDNTVDNAYPLTSSAYMKWILDRQSVLVDDFLISNLKPTSLDMIFDLLEIVGLDQAVNIARRVNLKKIILDKELDSLTLFVPTNEAIRKWREQVPADQADNVKLLNKLVKAWVVPEKLAVQFVKNDVQEPTLLENVKLRVNVYDREKITVNGAQIQHLAKIQTNRAIVNSIDRMIFPLPDGDMVAELKKAGHFSKLIDLIQKAGLQDYVAKTDALTCFAPTDAALAKVPADKMADLVANKDKLQRVLKYHIVPSTYYSAGLIRGPILKSVAGEKITIAYDAQRDEMKLNADPAQPELAPKVIKKDIPAFNGVIHVIDKILDLPQK